MKLNVVTLVLHLLLILNSQANSQTTSVRSNPTPYLLFHLNYRVFDGMTDGYYFGRIYSPSYRGDLANHQVEPWLHYGKGLLMAGGTITADSFNPAAKSTPWMALSLVLLGDFAHNASMQIIFHSDPLYPDSKASLGSGKFPQMNPYLRVAELLGGSALWFYSTQTKGKPQKIWNQTWRKPLIFFSYSLNGWLEGATRSFNLARPSHHNLQIVNEQNLHWLYLAKRTTATFAIDFGRGWEAPLWKKILVTGSALVIRDFFSHVGEKMVMQEEVNPARLIQLGVGTISYLVFQ